MKQMKASAGKMKHYPADGAPMKHPLDIARHQPAMEPR